MTQVRLLVTGQQQPDVQPRGSCNCARRFVHPFLAVAHETADIIGDIVETNVDHKRPNAVKTRWRDNVLGKLRIVAAVWKTATQTVTGVTDSHWGHWGSCV